MVDYITIGNLETDLGMLSDCDWVIEVVAENLEIKHTLFDKILPRVNKNAILSTNTSGLPIKSIADHLPENVRARFLGTHFFNPPRYMRLLEIIPSVYTDAEVTGFMKDFGYAILGKGVVEAKDTPNFIGNRIGAMSIPFLLRLMEKYGFEIETVDYLTGQLIGRPRSATFKTMDIVGLDVTSHVVDNLTAVVNDEEKALFVLPEYIREMVRGGQLGNKSGGGFYKQVKGGKGEKITLVWDREKREYSPPKSVRIPFVEEAKKQRRLKDRLAALLYSDEPAGCFLWEAVSALLLYSARKAPEIADSYEEIDKAIRWGYNWDVGPFELWDLAGFQKSADKMREDGAKLPEWIEKRLAKREPFYINEPDIQSLSQTYAAIRKIEHSVLLDMGDGVLGLEINTPGNCITTQFCKELTEVLDLVEGDNAYAGLVLLNSNNNFLTGADLKFILGVVTDKAFDLIEETLADFQRVSLRLKYAKKPVVAAIHGMVLGGGMEYAIHTSRIVAHAESYMGLVEAGVGLIPGGGGIKELLTRAVADISPYQYADLNPVVYKYWESIATGAVSKNAFHAQQMGYLLPTDKIVMQIDLLPQRAKEEVLLLAKEGYRQKLPTMTHVTGTSGCAYLEQTINAMCSGGFISEYDAVIAQKIAKAITGGGVPKGAPLSEAELLKLEREGFLALCHNDKTRERIKAMMETGRTLRN
jgi:3-hydroxyacyl-CoA dehydrogenase